MPPLVQRVRPLIPHLLAVLRIQTLLIPIRILLITLIPIQIRILLFTLIWIQIRLFDMDPDRFIEVMYLKQFSLQVNFVVLIRVAYGSRSWKMIRILTDPDPQHWLLERFPRPSSTGAVVPF